MLRHIIKNDGIDYHFDLTDGHHQLNLQLETDSPVQLPVTFVLISEHPLADNSTIQWISDETSLILSPHAITLYDDPFYLKTSYHAELLDWSLEAPEFDTMIIDGFAYETNDGVNLTMKQSIHRQGTIEWSKQQDKVLNTLLNNLDDDNLEKHQRILSSISIRQFITPPNSAGVKVKEQVGRISRLIELGLTINALNEDEQSPLTDAISYGYNGIIKLLLEHDADLNSCFQDYGLSNALIKGHSSVIRELVFGNHGLDCDSRILIKNDYRYGYYKSSQVDLVWPRFHKASAFLTENINIIRMIVTACCDIDAQTSSGFTTLMFAVISGHEDIVDLLINEGANVNQQTCMGQTALIMATAHSHTSIVKRLFNANADRSLMEGSGKTAGQIALQQKNTEIKQLFFGSKLPDWELDAQSNNGRYDQSEESTEHASAKHSAF